MTSRPFERFDRLLLLLWLTGSALGFGTAFGQSVDRNTQSAGSPPGDQRSWIGARVVDYLAELQSAGLNIIYSSELVPDSLTIGSEPIGATARIRLGSVLARIGLTLDDGPQGSLLIVRERAPQTANAPETTTPRIDIAPPPLENIIVAASRYAFARDPVASGSFVDRVQLESTPAIGDDALRPLANVPGVSANGLSGQVSIRGGAANEALMLLDGIELRNPFHLKDFESIFGSISPRIVETMNVYTGGFSARYGGRMSGVIDIRTIEPQDQREFELGISTINTSFLGSGRFDDGDGSYLVSMRRGTVDLILDAADSEFGSPQFSDFFGNVSKRIGRNGSLRFGLLSLNDKISLNDGLQSRAGADYNDNYIWTAFDHDLSDSLSAEYALTILDMDSHRDGFTNDQNTSIGTLLDRRSYAGATFTARWDYRHSDSLLLEWGATLRRIQADYDFASSIAVPFPIAGPLPTPGTGAYGYSGRFTDSQSAAHVNARLRLHREVTLELGARADRQSIVDDATVSPRLGIVWDVSDRLALRAAWGRYTQMQGLDEIHVPDRLPQLFKAQESDQAIVSVEFAPGTRTRMRLEWFDKEIANPHLRFENLFTRLSLLPELMPDRVRIDSERARASGVEFSLEGDLPDWRWWLSYTRSDAEDLVAGAWLPRSWQENWSAKAGVIRTLPRWTIAANLFVRAGWPVSLPLVSNGQLTVSAFNNMAFESFRSVDVKASRYFDVRRGRVEIYGELINALDANNACCFEHTIEPAPGGGIAAAHRSTQQWLPSVPVLGVLWTF